MRGVGRNLYSFDFLPKEGRRGKADVVGAKKDTIQLGTRYYPSHLELVFIV